MNNKTIKVYSLATTYPESRDSKKPKFVHVINRELVNLGLQVKTITPHSKDSLAKEILDGVRIHRFKYLPQNQEFNYSSIPDEISKSKIGNLKLIVMVFAFFMFTFYECIKEKPDVFHAHWSFPSGVIAFIMSKIFGKKFIVTIHGGEIPLLKKFKLIRRIVIFALNRAYIVCANSNYSRNEFLKMGVNEDKISKLNVPPNFVRHISDKQKLESFRNKFADPSKKIVLFCGRLVERKGVEYLIRAIADLKMNSVHLIIAGGGELENDLQELTKSLKLEDKVTFYGRASDEELGWLHDVSSIFVCPSIVDSKGITEYLGLVIPEAMESGLPVIASSVGGIVDIITNEVNGLLVPQKDPAAIARTIERIILDDDLTKKIVENSKVTVLEFSPKTIAQKYLDIFKKLANS